MNPYERLVEQMQIAGKKHNPSAPMIGLVSENGEIKLDTMTLDIEDYLLNCNLRLDDTEKVYVHKAKTSSGEYLTDAAHNGTLKEVKENILSKGDQVVVIKLDGFEKYIVLAKVVEPE